MCEQIPGKVAVKEIVSTGKQVMQGGDGPARRIKNGDAVAGCDAGPPSVASERGCDSRA